MRSSTRQAHAKFSSARSSASLRIPTSPTSRPAFSKLRTARPERCALHANLRARMKRALRIGNGQGFWGDSVDAPVELLRGGPIDYLGMDYLAEVTLSIM